MSSKGFRERILEVETAGSALTGTLTETSLLHSSHLTALIPAGYFDQKQRRIAFEFSGQISNRITGPDTFKFQFYLGSVAVFSSGLIPLNVVAKTNVHWHLTGELVCQAFGGGTATTLFPKGCKFTSESVIGSPAATAGGHGTLLLPFNTAPVAGTGFDNNPSYTCDIRGTHSTTTTNSIQLMAGHIELVSQ
jgi:hypothetical protein